MHAHACHLHTYIMQSSDMGKARACTWMSRYSVGYIHNPYSSRDIDTREWFNWDDKNRCIVGDDQVNGATSSVNRPCTVYMQRKHETCSVCMCGTCNE